MKGYGVNIIGLSNTLHQFQYELSDRFFEQYSTGILSKGDFIANVALDKHETFIEATFDIKGTAELSCDRSLETFDHPIKSHHKIVFKFGDKDEELSDEIVLIHRDTPTLELGQYIYEFIALAIPIKKLHPRFQDEQESENENAEGKIVYTSESKSEEKNDEIDPRWDILKKLK